MTTGLYEMSGNRVGLEYYEIDMGEKMISKRKEK